MIVYRRMINMVPGGQTAVINLSQYDSDVILEFELYASEGTFVVENDTTVLIRGTKPDGNGISLDGEIESTLDPVTGKYTHIVTVEVIQQMTAVAGKALYELSLRKDDVELNTANFVLDIERAPLDAETLPSESVIKELVDVTEQAEEIIAAAQQVEDALATIDATLTQQGRAADAKVVGDEVAGLKNNNDAIKQGFALVNGDLIKGSLNENGEIVTSTNNYCWSNIQNVGRDITLTIDSGYRLYIAYYDANKDYLGASSWYTSANASGATLITGTAYINVRVQTVPIAVVDVDSIKGHFEVRSFIAKDPLFSAPLLASGTDLDDIQESGTYRLGTSSSYTHSPLVNAEGLLQVIKTQKASFTVQIAKYYLQEEATYVRYLSGSPLTWKPWKKEGEIVKNSFVSSFARKKIAVVGDSISSYADARYSDASYVKYYPALGVDDVNQTWWMLLANASSAEIVCNESEAGSYASNQRPDGRIDFYARVNVMAERDIDPDLIFVALGTNDSVGSVALGDYDFDTTYTELSEETFRTAYIKGVKALQSTYPNAQIVCLIFQMGADYAASIRNIATNLGVEYLNIQRYRTGSSVHPDAIGMIEVASQILNYREVTALTMNYAHGITNLDDFVIPGVYILSSAYTYDQAPAELSGQPYAAHLFVFNYKNEGDDYLIQRLFYTAGNSVAEYKEYIRIRNTSSNWNAWVKVYDKSEAINYFKFNINGQSADLNDYAEMGFYILSGSTVYDNSPDEITTGAKHLLVYKPPTENYIIQRLFYTAGNSVAEYREYVRIRNNATNWNAWVRVYDKYTLESIAKKFTGNKVLVPPESASTNTTPYTGTALRIMSYNVAKYNKDTTTYLTQEKISNFRKMLMELHPDFVAVQEDGTIDGDSKTAHDYLYAPIYPVEYGTGVCTIRSKISASHNYGVMSYTNGRWLRAASFDVGGKTLLLCSTHAGLTEEARAEEYEELFAWVHGEIALPVATDDTIERQCGEWDYCVICGDMNSLTSEDKASLSDLASERGFTMANGGYLGWLETRIDNNGVTNPSALDNIICSPNIVITNIESHKDMYDDLYSDHYPFVADIILKGN